MGEADLYAGAGSLVARGVVYRDRVAQSSSRDAEWTGEFETDFDLASYIAPTDQTPPANAYTLRWSDGRSEKVKVVSSNGPRGQFKVLK